MGEETVQPEMERPPAIVILCIFWALGGIWHVYNGAMGIWFDIDWIIVGWGLHPAIPCDAFLSVCLILLGIVMVYQTYGFWKGVKNKHSVGATFLPAAFAFIIFFLINVVWVYFYLADIGENVLDLPLFINTVIDSVFLDIGYFARLLISFGFWMAPFLIVWADAKVKDWLGLPTDFV